MRILLGEAGERDTLDKIAWIQHTFTPETYKITADGWFQINEYFVTFQNPRHETMFRLKYSQ